MIARDVRFWTPPKVSGWNPIKRARQWLFGRDMPGFRSRWEWACAEFELLFLNSSRNGTRYTPAFFPKWVPRLTRYLNGGKWF